MDWRACQGANLCSGKRVKLEIACYSHIGAMPWGKHENRKGAKREWICHIQWIFFLSFFFGKIFLRLSALWRYGSFSLEWRKGGSICCSRMECLYLDRNKVREVMDYLTEGMGPDQWNRASKALLNEQIRVASLSFSIPIEGSKPSLQGTSYWIYIYLYLIALR